LPSPLPICALGRPCSSRCTSSSGSGARRASTRRLSFSLHVRRSVLMLVAFLVLLQTAGLGPSTFEAGRGPPVNPETPDLASSSPAPSPSRSRSRCGRSTLAPRRARGGSHRGVGHPGRGAPQDGRLRLPAGSPSPLPERRCGSPLVGVLAVIASSTAPSSPWCSPTSRSSCYSSVSHLGFVMLGIAGLHHPPASWLRLPDAESRHLDRGPSSSSSECSTTGHTRLISEFGGLKGPSMPGTSRCSWLIRLSSIGVPGFNGFVGEFRPPRLVDVQPVDGGGRPPA